MEHEKITIKNKPVDTYVIPINNKFNIVFITTEKGMLACGAIDAMVLDKFNFPVVRIKSKSGTPITTVNDLLSGEVRDMNNSAAKLGITENMTISEIISKI